jgi:hypothetical protein
MAAAKLAPTNKSTERAFILGPFTQGVRAVVVGLKFPVERWIVRPYWTVSAKEAEARTRRADRFLGLLLLLDVLALISLRVSGMATFWFVIGFLVWRIVDIVATALRLTLFAERPPEGIPVPQIAPARAVVYGFTYFFESIFCFGAIYAAFPEYLYVSTKTAGPFLDAMHLSFITAFTIGYGDVSPLGWLRPIAWVQGACTMVLVVLMVARFVGLVEAIERTSHEG